MDRFGEWVRAYEHDRRIRSGDDFSGDAWRNIRTGKIRYAVVGYVWPEWPEDELTEKREHSASEKEAGGSAREEPPASDEFNLTGGLWHPL